MTVGNGGDDGGGVEKSSTALARLDYPYGRTVFWKLVEEDHAVNGTPKLRLYGRFLVTAVLLVLAPFVPSFVARRYGDDPDYYRTDWDLVHSIGYCRTLVTRNDSGKETSVRRCDFFGLVTDLLRETMGIGFREACLVLAFGVCLPFALLFVADLTNQRYGAPRWPRSWNISNSVCYDDMFCEPERSCADDVDDDDDDAAASGSSRRRQRRRPCLVRRPGNTYSNAVYLFASECVLYSCLCTSLPNDFWGSDVAYGIMLFVLSVSSILWHASNAPKVHYVDLWSMDSSIAYLLIKHTFVVVRHRVESLRSASPLLCAIVYVAVIVALAAKGYRNAVEGVYDRGFGLSARALLRARRDGRNVGVGGVHLTTLACAYASLPVVAVLYSTATEVTALRHARSVASCSWGYGSFCVGWGGPRMWERFLLDGWEPTNTIARLSATSRWATFAAAATSPTAWLHACTGLTILFGYASSRVPIDE